MSDTTVTIDSSTNGLTDLPDKPVSKFNLRSHILNLDDTHFEDVYVEPWDTTFRVVGMTGKERARMLQQAMNDEDKLDLEKMTPLVIIATTHEIVDIIDDDGEVLHNLGPKVFKPEDVEALNAKSGAALDTLQSAGLRLSGLDSKANEKAGKASSEKAKQDSTSS